MSTSEGTKAGRPLRTSGLILLALAAAAGLIGLVSAASGEVQTPAGQRPAATSTSRSASDAPTTTPLAPTPTSAPVSTPTADPAPSPAPPAPADVPAGLPAPGDPAGPASPGTDNGVVGGTPDFRGEARVYNNSNIAGLASRAADDLNAAGWTVVEIANYSAGTIPTTTVYYQEGTDQRATAEAIGAEFGMRVEPRFDGIVNASPGVIVIVTRDYGR